MLYKSDLIETFYYKTFLYLGEKNVCIKFGVYIGVKTILMYQRFFFYTKIM